MIIYEYKVFITNWKYEEETSSTTGMRNTGAYYWLASTPTSNGRGVRVVLYDGCMGINSEYCWGVRHVVSLKSGVYIKAGTGTEADPYILGKD